MKTLLILWSYLLFFLLQKCSNANDILGCGGFVKSRFKLDFDKIEIKLFTKQGSLKLKTECAPSTGYYFIPLESKGDYVLRISPPSGWTFTPTELAIQFDGESDPCSKGEDINFEFKGFSVLGKVITSGFAQGPKDVELILNGPDKLELKIRTEEGGAFQFPSIPPGSYVLKAKDPTKSFKFEKDEYKFEIVNRNVVVDEQIIVSGYQLTGHVKSDRSPLEKVTVVLVSGDDEIRIPKGCTNDQGNGVSLPSNIKGKVLCVQNSDKEGVFKFEGLSPGKYTVVPVYKGLNLVYNVNPPYLDVTLPHGSLALTSSFEVEGFTVQGRVKGHSGAKIFVNGQHKATSGHDGSFTITNMKPRTYEFEVIADKFVFDKKMISVQPTNPVLPDFVPSRFQMCGTVMIKSKTMPEITLTFKKSDGDQVYKEKITDTNNACVHLPEGNFVAWIESEKYFTPEKVTVQVPSGNRFHFQEFSGSIQGSVVCKIMKCEGVRVRAENMAGGLVQELGVNADGTFKFENVESGDYRVLIIANGHCWKADKIDKIQLKNANVDNLQFIQTGIPLEIEASHSTSVKITGKGPSSTQVLQLEGGTVKTVCLSDPDSPPDSYRIIPEGCHVFEKAEYSFIPSSRLVLIARKHKHSWIVTSSSRIQDLKISRNGEAYNLESVGKGDGVQIHETSNGDSFTYKVTSWEESGREIEWQIFSYGFIFEPSSFVISALNDCQENMMRVVAKESHVIKGKFNPPLEGVQIRIDLIGDPDSTVHVTSNPKGEYIAGPFVHSSGFIVTPQLPGYTFKPTDKDPYSFSVFQMAKIQVKVETGDDSNNPVPGVLLSLSGPSAYRQNRATDDRGEMTFGELQPGQYYIKALLKEFQFQPRDTNIDLKEQETKTVVLRAVRESFSLYGQLTSLSGELMPDLLVSAKGVGNCSEYGEEGVSDEMGNFRIWALKSYCTYNLTLATHSEYATKVERTIPQSLQVKISQADIHTNTSFIVITPVRRMDISLRVHTNNEKSLDHLRAIVYSSSKMEVPLHTISFNGISYLILPPIPKDDTDYTIILESTLNRYQYNYKLPSDITFTANSAYAHFNLEFNIFPVPVDQEIGKNSYIAFALVLLVVLAIANYELVGVYVKSIVERYQGGSISTMKKGKGKAKQS